MKDKGIISINGQQNGFVQIMQPRYSASLMGAANPSVGPCLLLTCPSGIFIHIHEIHFSILGGKDTYTFQIQRGTGLGGSPANHTVVTAVSMDTANTATTTGLGYIGATATKPSLAGATNIIQGIFSATNDVTGVGQNSEPNNIIYFKDPLVFRPAQVFGFSVGVGSGGGFPGGVAINVIFSEETPY